MKLFLLYLILLFQLFSYSFCHTFPLKRIKNELKTIEKKDGSYEVSLNGGISVDGEFYVQVLLGTPPVEFLLQVDTGSSDLLVYTSKCSDCNGTYYFHEKSSTSSLIACSDPFYRCLGCQDVGTFSSCSFSDTYGDGSNVKGFLVSDYLSVGEMSNITVTFGGITFSKSSSFENKPVSGIWGLAYSPLSSWYGPPVFDDIVVSTGISNIFSLCLNGNIGEMSMGIDYSNDPNFNWTPIIEEAWYVIQLNSISVGNINLPLPSESVAIVDSGTTLMLLPDVTYNSFSSYLTNSCPGSNLAGVCGEAEGILLGGSCVSMSESQVNAFPSVQFDIGNIPTFTLPPSQYLYYDSNGYYCMGISSSGSNDIIFGDIFMQGYHVVFDRQNSKVGFGPLNTCPPNATLYQSNIVSTTSESLIIFSSTIFIFFFVILLFCMY